MRYTTIIDISASRVLYSNINTRLVYLHLVLKSGYHDNDRDLLECSIRKLASDVGISVSATRNAIKQLEKLQMIQRNGSVIWVRKFVIEQPITRRATTQKQARQQAATATREAEQERRDKEAKDEQKRRLNDLQNGKNAYMLYFEEKQRLALMGDTEAQEFCVKNRYRYEQHKIAVQQQLKELNK